MRSLLDDDLDACCRLYQACRERAVGLLRFGPHGTGLAARLLWRTRKAAGDGVPLELDAVSVLERMVFDVHPGRCHVGVDLVLARRQRLGALVAAAKRMMRTRVVDCREGESGR